MLLSILDIEILIYITISFFDLLSKECVCVHLPAEKGFFFHPFHESDFILLYCHVI